jgi:hypothetical protein
MKKLLLLTLISSFSFVDAQVLQTENFNALTLGNIGTDITGLTIGQDNWLTFSNNGTAPTTSTNADNANFQIVATGNAATNGLKLVAADGNKGGRFMWKAGFDALWDARTSGNDILEVEYDLFTGAATTSTSQFGVRVYGTDLDVTPNARRVLNGFVYTANTRVLQGVAYLNNAGTFGTFVITLGAAPLVLDANTWYRIGFAYDTATGETIWKASTIYTGLPAANWAGPFTPDEVDFVSATPTTNSVVSELTFDNLRVRATPTEALLGVKDVEIAENNFSVYPNPANNFISFSNTLNATVNTVELADMNGRIVKSLIVNASEGQITISDLATGMYMMKISTDAGTVTKKIVKQ